MNTRPPLAYGEQSVHVPTTPFPSAKPMIWDRLFPLLAPDLQADLLARIRTDDPTEPPTLSLPRAEGFLARWLQSSPSALPAVPTQSRNRPLGSCPGMIPAIAAIAAAQDLFLIDAEAGPVQWKLAIELVSAKLQPGQRLVVLTATGSEADEILGQLVASHPKALMARAVAPMEDLRRLPPSSATRTAQAHGQQVLNNAQLRVRQNLQVIDAQIAPLCEAVEAVVQVQALLPRLPFLRQQRDAVQAELAGLAVSPELATRQREELAHHQRQLLELQAATSEHQTACEQTEQSLAEAKKQRAGLGGLFRSFFASGAPDPVELEARFQSLQGELLALQQRLQQWDRSKQELLRQHESELADEQSRVQRDRDTLEQRLNDLNGELQPLEESASRARSLVAALGCSRPAEHDTAAWTEVATVLQNRLSSARQEQAGAADWLRQLETSRTELVTSLLELPQVVVAPFAAVTSDPLLTGDHRFHTLLLLGCEHREETEINQVTQRCRQQILLGDLAAMGRGGTVGPRPHLNGYTKPTQLATTRGQAFRKLWNHLHHERWTEEEGCLIARLLKVEGLERGALLREPLADRPEIEIRFLKQPTGELQVAELAFPPGMQAAEAKCLLFSELGESWLTPYGPEEWDSTAEQIRVRWPLVQDATEPGDWVPLDPGVQELCLPGDEGGRTAAVTFDRHLGWTAESAADWLSARWSPGRTIRVPRANGPATESIAARPVLARAAGGVV